MVDADGKTRNYASTLADLPPGWTAATGGHHLEQELERELASGHQLHDKSARAIARRHDRDDVLFLIENDEPAVAEVHLTWSGSRAADAKWPATTMYDSVEEWRAQAADAEL